MPKVQVEELARLRQLKRVLPGAGLAGCILRWHASFGASPLHHVCAVGNGAMIGLHSAAA